MRILNSPAAVIPGKIYSNNVTEPETAWEGLNLIGKVRRPAMPTIKDIALEDWRYLKTKNPYSIYGL